MRLSEAVVNLPLTYRLTGILGAVSLLRPGFTLPREKRFICLFVEVADFHDCTITLCHLAALDC